MFIPETEIIITRDGVELARATVKPGDYVIGSAESSDIVVRAEDVAERHAQLTVNYHELFIENLGAGSTSVAGNAVKGCTRIWPTQKVQLGSVALETRRIKSKTSTDQSLAPETQMVRDLLPAEFLRDKKYDIGGLVAQGGMGDIVDAFEATTGRTVAMKVMLSSLSEEEILRFIGEAQITSQLEHPNIIPVHELGVDEEDHVFYTMKMVQGITLRQLLKKIATRDASTIAAYPLAVLMTIFQKVCNAVAFAHSRSVIHQDLKPANIMVGQFGEVLVVNWGKAKVLGAEEDPSSSKSEPPSPRTDILALGAILYQILSLRSPADDGPIESLHERHILRGKKGPASSTRLKNRPHLPGGRIPDSLAAIAMKALSADPRNQYAAVPELQADITAYQDGFATSAERASLLKQLALLVDRHRRETMALAASLVVLVALGIGAYVYIARERNVALLERQHADKQRIDADRESAQATAEQTLADRERERAERTLNNLRTAAPAYHRQATAFIQVQKLDEALKSIGFALALAPDDPENHLFRANTLQAMQRLPEAIESYRRVLAVRPGDAAAESNLKLCERLLAEAGGQTLPRALQTQLLDALVAQKRSAESVFLASSLGREADARMANIKAKLGSLTKDPKWDDARFTRRDDGTVELDLSDLALPDLSSLSDFPISALNIARVGASDLRPLAALPLTKLDCSGNPISDLSPLSTRPLKQLFLDSTQVADLSPLKEMHLEQLSLRQSAVTDLSTLQGMPLETLSLTGLSIASIEALRGMPLRRLDCFGCQQLTDLSPLTTLNGIETLILPAGFADLALVQKLRSLKRLGNADFGTGTAAFDKVPSVASFLASHGQRLTLQNKLASRLENLRQTLRQYGAPETKISAIALNADGFMNLDFAALPLDSLAALSGLPVRRLVIKATKVSDLTPLRGMPLTVLDASETPIKDLTPLAACPSLTSLDVSQTGVTDLRALTGLKLERLALSQTAVQDLGPILRMPLRALFFDDTKVEDLLPLTTCPTLESITLSTSTHNLNLLRKLPAVRRISTKRDTLNGQPAQTAAAFWTEFDTGGKTREAQTKLNAALAKLQTLSGWKEKSFEKRPDGTYKFDLRDVGINDLSPLRDLPVSVLDITATAVTRLAPIVNCPIHELYAVDCAIGDLATLGRLPLERLSMTQYNDGDLQHLRNLKLRRLRVFGRSNMPLIADLSPLKGMPLESLVAEGYLDLENLKALQGAPLTELFIPGSGVKDLNPLRRLPLTVLDVRGTRITDLAPLRNLALTRLDLMYTEVRDVSLLADCKTLKELGLPRNANKGIEALRKLPNLAKISLDRSNGKDQETLAATDFWLQYDKQKKP